MEQLRTILIILGLVLVAGIWLADFLRRRRAMRAPHRWNEVSDINEAAISEEDMLSTAISAPDSDEWVGKAFSAQRSAYLDDEQLEELKGLGQDDDNIPLLTAVVEDPSAFIGTEHSVPAEEVIVLTLMAPERRQLRGPLLLKALQEAGLAHGVMEVFHFHVEGHKEPLFSVANILEPGRFVLSELAQLETPGLALFMRLPTMMPGEDALRIMLQKAHQVAAQLNASLCDSQRRPLDDASLAKLYQTAEQFPAL